MAPEFPVKAKNINPVFKISSQNSQAGEREQGIGGL
jgi:hypothetical protein